jgi:hypothetical protein
MVRVPLLTVLLVWFWTLHAQMYDPFQAALRMKTPPEVLRLPPPPKLLPPLSPSPIPPAVVSAILNDKVFINGAWYRVGDTIDHREVAFIQNAFVGLKEKERLIVMRVGSAPQLLRPKETP